MSEGLSMIHDALDIFSRPRGVKMTEYTFEISRKVKVTMKGNDTEENQEKAVYKAIEKVMNEIDDDWFEYVDADEFEDFEN